MNSETQVFMYDVMVNKGNRTEIADMFIWLTKQGLQPQKDWIWYTIPASPMMKVSFHNAEHAVWFKLKWS